ncbi:unnamed protein product, partial [Nesidiocoris tenuis]
MQLKKKIAGRFSSEVAYKILTQVQFKTNHDDSFITALVLNRHYLESVRTEGLGNRQADNLSKSQITYLSEQLEAVYGVNG